MRQGGRDSAYADVRVLALNLVSSTSDESSGVLDETPAGRGMGVQVVSRYASSNRFHEPLHPSDSEIRTFGCRHSNPRACSKHYLQDVCAYVREDKICISPPRSWSQQFRR